MSAFLYLSKIWGEKRVHLIKMECVILHVWQKQRGGRKGQQIHNQLEDANPQCLQLQFHTGKLFIPYLGSNWSSACTASINKPDFSVYFLKEACKQAVINHEVRSLLLLNIFFCFPQKNSPSSSLPPQLIFAALHLHNWFH